MIEDRNSFYAERIISNVINADGSDGGNNLLIAYDENLGITGMTGSLGNGVFRNVPGSVSKGEIESKIGGCSGTAIKCLKSVTVSTDQKGWPGSKSYTIKITS